MNNRQEIFEEGVDIPLDRINPDTLRRMLEEFVTREWSDLTDADLSQARLHDAKFTNAITTRTRFDGAKNLPELH